MNSTNALKGECKRASGVVLRSLVIQRLGKKGQVRWEVMNFDANELFPDRKFDPGVNIDVSKGAAAVGHEMVVEVIGSHLRGDGDQWEAPQRGRMVISHHENSGQRFVVTTDDQRFSTLVVLANEV